jgi:hypothetical protein
MLDIVYCLKHSLYTLHFGRQLLYFLSLEDYCNFQSGLPEWSIGSVLVSTPCPKFDVICHH